MKKTLLTLAFAAVANFGAWAQQTYNFTATTGTYADLTSATLLSGTTVWDDTVFTLPLGFNFTLENNVYSSVDIDSNAGLFFSNGTSDQGIVATHADLLDRGTTTSSSPISYLVSGTAPNRIFKVEWKNAGFYDGVAADFMNVQIWLYEANSKIEMHYGTSALASPANVYSPFSGPITGLVYQFGQTGISGNFLQGNPTAPTAVVVANTAMPPFLNAISPNGTVYTFTRTISGVAKELANASVSVYPNPTSDVLHVNGLPASQEAASVKIYDVLGKVVLSETLAASQSVNISALKNGTYFMEITAGENRIGKNIIKQ